MYIENGEFVLVNENRGDKCLNNSNEKKNAEMRCVRV